MCKPLAVIHHMTTLRASPMQAREIVNLNREWRFQLGDLPGSGAPNLNTGDWELVHLPHSFSLPYFLSSEFYTGYGWYRKALEIPPAWEQKRISIEFEGAFQEAEIFINGNRIGTHCGGYVGFQFDLTDSLKPGTNLIAVRLNNVWRAHQAPRAGDHTFSGGLYRDVRLVVTDPLHVDWNGTFVTTPTLAEHRGSESTVHIQTEIRNTSSQARATTLRTDIVDANGQSVASVSTTLTVPANTVRVFHQTTTPLSRPKLWNTESPHLYQAVTTVMDGDRVTDTHETPFGFRWFEWTADRGFFLNGKHLYLRGANVHQDQAGWGDAVTNASHDRDVRIVKEAGFNFIRGSHYPKAPSFSTACDRHGILWMSENCFWGIGGVNIDGGWNASAYPVTPEDETAFEESVLHSLRSMIRIHRNHPSIISWSMGNEVFFSEPGGLDQVRGLLKKAVALTHNLDPTRPAAIGGAQRPLDDGRIDLLGDIAAYNGDGGTQPLFQHPGIPSLVSEYGSVVADRPGAFDPGWGDLKTQLTEERPTRFPWRAGEAVWCMFDHGSHGGVNLARMGIVDFFRIPKRAYYWYRETYAGIPPPTWPVEEAASRIDLRADKTALAAPDGTDDALITITLCNKAGAWVNRNVPVTLAVVSGPGEFPTGSRITFTPPGKGEASDIVIRDGKAAIVFRSHHAGETILRASAPGLPDAKLILRTEGDPVYEPGVTAPVADRPYVRFQSTRAKGMDHAAPDVLARHRPTRASSSAPGHASGLANDGNPATSWRAEASATGVVSWEVFLEVAYDIHRITLEFPEEAAYRYVIEVSADGGGFKRVVDQSDNRTAVRRVTASGAFGEKLDSVRVRFATGPQEPVPALSGVEVGGGCGIESPNPTGC